MFVCLTWTETVFLPVFWWIGHLFFGFPGPLWFLKGSETERLQNGLVGPVEVPHAMFCEFLNGSGRAGDVKPKR